MYNPFPILAKAKRVCSAVGEAAPRFAQNTTRKKDKLGSGAVILYVTPSKNVFSVSPSHTNLLKLSYSQEDGKKRIEFRKSDVS